MASFIPRCLVIAWPPRDRFQLISGSDNRNCLGSLEFSIRRTCPNHRMLRDYQLTFRQLRATTTWRFHDFQRVLFTWNRLSEDPEAISIEGCKLNVDALYFKVVVITEFVYYDAKYTANYSLELCLTQLGVFSFSFHYFHVSHFLSSYVCIFLLFFSLFTSPLHYLSCFLYHHQQHCNSASHHCCCHATC